jgi:hypothetical protein
MEFRDRHRSLRPRRSAPSGQFIPPDERDATCPANPQKIFRFAKKAFEKNEVACERLGSVHLLSHGIYAFKVDAVGARTDLVFNEPPSDAMLTQAVEGTVLTEWKIAKDAKDAIAAVRAARIKADLYSQGAFAGLELRSHRYIIVVTPKELPSGSLGPDDRTAAGFIYRHVNIVIESDVPSKVSKTLARAAK